MKKTVTLSLLSTLLLSNLNAQVIELEPLTIESTQLQNNELNSPDAVEIYTSEDINNAHVQTLSEFIQKNTSLTTMPSFGNPFTPLLDMRGYGIENGNENIVIRLNGRKLNNIDNVPQLLASIPPSSIERLEILKGSGIVQNGDGANAGVINIITKNSNNKEISLALGSQSSSNINLYLGHSSDLLSLSLAADFIKTDGTRRIDNNNKTDEQKMGNVAFNIALTPRDDLEVRFGVAKTNIDSFYGSYLTLDEYRADPSQPGATNFGYTHQKYKTTIFSTGLTYDITDTLNIQADYSNEKKKSEFLGSFPSTSNYNYDNFSTSANYIEDNFRLITGFEGFRGNRDGYGGDIDKNNYAGYMLAQYTLEQHTFKAGYRYERVFYKQDQTTTDNTKDYTLHGAELSYNYKINKENSTFLSYARSYQAPSIDRLLVYVFPTGGVFKNFLEPMKADTYTLGYNNFTVNNKFKASVFYSDLKNEFYFYTGPGGSFDPASKNTNIDESSKYGVELYDRLNITEKWNLALTYTYVRAKIDKEIENGVDLGGNTLPGVPKHSAKATLNYQPNENTTLALVQTYRSEAFALNDTENNFDQRQEKYYTTDISITYAKETYEVFAKLNNLFDHSNGLWVSDDAIYPTNFRTTFLTGVKLKF